MFDPEMELELFRKKVEKEMGITLEELEEDLPKVIVVEKNKISQRIYTFLLTHGYTLMWSAEEGNIASDSVYVREK